MKPERIRWTPEVVKQLEVLVNNYSLETVADIMETNKSVISRACSNFQIKHKRQRRVWSEEDDQFLIRNAGFMPIQRMADMLGRSYAAVQNRACMHLNISLKLK